MSRNGSGTYNPPVNSWNPAINAVTATAADWQAVLNDLASAITQSVSKDGQTPLTGNLPAGNNKLTGLSAGNAAGDSLRFEQLFSQGQPADLASAATTDIGSQLTTLLNITGTTTITSFGTAYNGPRFVRFAGALTLTHNATTLILPGAANITTAAGDSAIIVPNGTPANGWCVAAYQKATNWVVPQSGNKFINGAMVIDQRNSGAAQTITAGAVLAYTVDRWYGYCTGANVTGQRVAGTAPNQYNYRYTGAASVTKIGHAQRIEAANCQDLAGTTATLSVDLANSLLTTVTWSAWYANTADTFGTLASPTRTLISTGTFTVSGALGRYTTQITVPSAATTGIEIEFSVAGQTSGTWTIGRAQFEAGGVATPFQVRPIGEELALCQRYLPVFIDDGSGAAAVGMCTGVSATSGTLVFPFKVTPRITPTDFTVSSPSHFSLSGALGITPTGITFSTTTSPLAGVLTISVAAGWSAGYAVLFRSQNIAAKLIWIGCEL